MPVGSSGDCCIAVEAAVHTMDGDVQVECGLAAVVPGGAADIAGGAGLVVVVARKPAEAGTEP